MASPWLKSPGKKGKEEYLSITESKVLLPEFVLLCKRLSPCSQRGGHLFKTCLSFRHSSQHENLNPKEKTNIYVFCVIGRKGALVVSFYICIELPRGMFATGHSHVSGWRVVFASAWNKYRTFIVRD